jgi:hypothetical protein
MELSLFTVNGVVTATPLNNTLVAPLKSVPVMVTVVPPDTGPWLGARPVTVGGGGTALAGTPIPAAKTTITTVHRRKRVLFENSPVGLPMLFQSLIYTNVIIIG